MMEFGSILSGIGAIAGGFGLGSKGGDGIDVSENVRLSKHMFDQQMNNLKRHGISKVYGLGAGQGTVTPLTSQRSGGGISAGDIGSGLSQIQRGLQKQKQDPTAQAMEALGLREARQAAEQSEIQTEMMKLQLAKERQAAIGQIVSPAPGGSPGKAQNPYRVGFLEGENVRRPKSTIRFMGRDYPVGLLQSPEVAEEHFDEVGALGQGIYNAVKAYDAAYHQRKQRQAALDRAWRAEKYEQRKQRNQHHRYPFGESSRRRVYTWR